MDCTVDVSSSVQAVFVRSTPTTFVFPDDYRLQTSPAESSHGNFHRSGSSSNLRLVPVCDGTQRCSRALCYQRNNSTRSLLSIAEFDGQHSNVDAHSFEIQPSTEHKDHGYAKDDSGE